MTIIRTYHDKQNPYTVLNNQVLFDRNLSNAARGLWAQCMARKDDWVFHISEIIKNTKEGRDAVRGQINELIKNNYVARLQIKEKKGKRVVFKSVDYIFFESKITPEKKEEFLQEYKKRFDYCEFLELKDEEDTQKEFKKCLSQTALSYTESSTPENPTLSSTNSSLENTDLNNPPLLSPPKKPDKPKKEKISLRSEEEEFLLNKLLEETILSPKDKRRLIDSTYANEEIERALVIARSIKVKKTLMGLLFDILEKPHNYEKEQNSDPKQQLALSYNKKLAKVNPVLSKENEELIPKNIIKVNFYIKGIGYTQLSLNASDFEQEIKQFEKELDEYK